MASPLSVFASSNMADGALGGWTNPTYAYNDDGVQFATREGTVKNTWYGTLFGFDLSSIPDGATINSITLSAEWKNSANDSSGPVLYLGAKSGGSEVGTADTDTSGQTSFEVLSHAVSGLTTAQLKATGDNGFWAILRFRRTDNTAHSASVDYVKCVVEYTEPAVQLVIQDVVQGQTSEAPGFTQHHILVIQDVQQVQSPENSMLTQHNILAIQDVAQLQVLESPSLTNHDPNTSLTIQDVTQGQTAENISLTQHHLLAIQDVAQNQTAENISLVQHHLLAIQDAAQTQNVEGPGLTQHNILSIADATQGQAVENVSLVGHNPGGVQLEIADVVQGQAVESLALEQHHILTIQDVIQGQAAENIGLVQHNMLTIADVTQEQLAEEVIWGAHVPIELLEGAFIGLWRGHGKKMIEP